MHTVKHTSINDIFVHTLAYGEMDYIKSTTNLYLDEAIKINVQKLELIFFIYGEVMLFIGDLLFNP